MKSVTFTAFGIRDSVLNVPRTTFVIEVKHPACNANDGGMLVLVVVGGGKKLAEAWWTRVAAAASGDGGEGRRLRRAAAAVANMNKGCGLSWGP